MNAFSRFTFLLLFAATAVAEDPARMILLRRDWQTGMEHRVRHESSRRLEPLPKRGGSANVGTWKFTNEYQVNVWPAPPAGRLTGLQWRVFASEANSPGGGPTSFDSRKVAKGIPQNPVDTATWNALGESWTYFDDKGNFAGMTGAGFANGAFSVGGYPTPLGTVVKREDSSLIERICALDTVPPEPVAVGHRWEAEAQGTHHQIGLTSAKVNWEFLRVEQREGRECAVLGFKASLSALPGDAPGEEKQPERTIDKASSEGEVWLAIPTGVPVRESCRTEVEMSFERGIRTRTEDRDEMTLLAISPIDPAAPLPAPLKGIANGIVPPPTPPATPESMPPAAADAVVLRPVWKSGHRYLWHAVEAHDTRIDMQGMKMPLAFHLDGEFEEIVRPGEEAGHQVHEYHNLSRVARMGDGKGRVTFDSRRIDQSGQPRDEGMAEMWKIEREGFSFTLRDAAGVEKKRWVGENPAAFGDRKPPEIDAGTPKTLDHTLISPWTLPTAPKSPGESWPLKAEFATHMMADEIVVSGNYLFQGIEESDGKRVAVVEFSGTIAPIDPAAKAQPGRGRMEKGTIRGGFSIDLGSSTLVRSHSHSKGVTVTTSPGMKTGIGTTFDQRMDKTLISMEPLPPKP